jgi:hypothetical protein
VLGALSGGVVVIEIIIVVAIVALLVAVLVLYRRQQAGPKPDAAPPTAESYYADVSTLQGQGGAAPQGQPGGSFGAPQEQDPFSGFGKGGAAAAAAAPPQAPAPAPAPAAAPAAAPAPPPAGTPAGWLPDPTGVPDTLRYWDGNAWTQHVAQRS